jgi:RNA-directed DNA polymerase
MPFYNRTDTGFNVTQCESMLTSNRCLIAREPGEPLEMGTQKIALSAGALIDDAKKWNSIDWSYIRRQVRRLQVRIAKAVKEKRWNKVKALQYLLTRSLYAKLLAVKRVTSNKGKNTPGVDGVLWRGARAKWRALWSLRRRGYKPHPLRRIDILKKNGKNRPLSIPTMYDRAMQALYKLALAPVAETTADRNSYGFREGRGCADAIAAAFNALSKPNSATWVLEGDIMGCFDNITHEWMLRNIPMDKVILQKWLKAGYVENGITYPTRKGTPQGGILSPTLANMALDGLEEAVRSAVPRRSRVNFIRYADDFIITGKSKRLLERSVRPAVEAFLAERGLILSKEKTVITYIKKGCTFLGQTFRKHGCVLHITPSKEGVLALVRKVGALIRKYVSAPMPVLIKKLNETLRGWANYHRHVVASDAFCRIDSYVFEQLWRMLRRRHSRESKGWLIKRYWSATGRKHVFAVRAKTAKGLKRVYQVQRMSAIGIRRYIKVKADANPYLSEYAPYFWRRRHDKGSKLLAAMSARELRAMAAA